jgi:hypothetical protein
MFCFSEELEKSSSETLMFERAIFLSISNDRYGAIFLPDGVWFYGNIDEIDADPRQSYRTWWHWKINDRSKFFWGSPRFVDEGHWTDWEKTPPSGLRGYDKKLLDIIINEQFEEIIL